MAKILGSDEMRPSSPPDAIIVGDIGARDDQPLCRTDNFWDTQLGKFGWLLMLWEAEGCPVILQPGDVFEKWKATPALLRTILQILPPMVTIPGNHDLPGHNLEEYGRSGLAVLEAAGVGWDVLGVGERETSRKPDITVYGAPWGRGEGEHTPPGSVPTVRNILLSHTMIIQGKTGSGVLGGTGATEYLDQNPGFDLIVTGHNHTPIEVETEDGRVLVNPGSFTRQTAAEMHQPRIYLWWAKENILFPIIVPHDPSAITREHIDDKKEMDERIVAFVETLRGEGGDGGDGKGASSHHTMISFSDVVAEMLREAGDSEVEAKVNWAMDVDA